MPSDLRTSRTHGEHCIVVKGFTIKAGTAEGVCRTCDSPFADIDQVTRDMILILGYPASPFFRLMHQAGAVVATEGTPRIEAATYLRKLGRPAFFGAIDLLSAVSNGDKVRLVVTNENKMYIYAAHRIRPT